MKNLKNILFIAFVAVLCACKDDTEPGPTTGTISGKITHADNGSSLEGVNIKTQPASSAVNSDNEGNYSIPVVTPGQYEVIACITDYITDTVVVAVCEGRTRAGDIMHDRVIINTPPDEPANNSRVSGAVIQ